MLPELALDEFFPLYKDTRYFAYAEELDGPTVRRFRSLAGELGIYLALPLFEKSLIGTYYTASLVKYQDPVTGVWYQVIDKGGSEGNYLESSATALFVYFFSKAIREGYISTDYKTMTDRAFNGMLKEFIKEEQDGSYTITNCCAGAGLGGEPVYRDGSYEYYISEPVIENDPKSVGSFILAAIEYEKLNHK